MTALVSGVWVLGLLLQLTLLALLFTRRVARRFPFFTALIVFYSIRAVLLFAGMHFIPRDAYSNLFQALGVADLLLQILVAVELSRALVRGDGRSRLHGVVPVAVSLVISAGLTALLVLMLPARSPVPADRGAIFLGFVFALLLGWAIRTGKADGPAGIVLAGLAAVGSVGILAQAGKSVAAFHHSVRAFGLWSYMAVGVYLLALVWWNLRLGVTATLEPHALEPRTVPAAEG